jgi:hypothetical protein
MFRSFVAILVAAIAGVSWAMIQGRRREEAPATPLDEMVRLADWAI